MFGGTAIGLSGGAWPIWLILSSVPAQAANTTDVQTIKARRVSERNMG
jgi:hypothetical protein